MTVRMVAIAIGLALLMAPAAASAGTVSGTVTDERGSGVQPVHVELFNRSGGGSAGATWTDEDGRFAIDVSVGGYDVLFESQGEALSEWYGDTRDRALARPLTVPETGSVKADAVLAPGAGISGRLTNSQGAPVVGMLVRATTADGATVFGAGAPFTNENGEYRIRRLPPGSYKVRFGDGSRAPDEWYDGSQTIDHARPVPVVANFTAGGIDASLDLYGAIVGRLSTADGTSAAGGTVRFYRGTVGFAAADVEPDGDYAISHLAPGRYRVQFVPPSRSAPPGEALVPRFYGGTWFAEDAAELTVGDGETVVADGTAPREAVLAGALRFPDGSPARAIASVYDLAGRRVGGGPIPANGRWLVRGLPSGQLKVAFSSADLLPYDPDALTQPAPFFVETEYYKDRFSLGSADPVTATAGAISSGLDGTLTRAGTITGVLTGPGGAPVKGAKVFLVRSDGRRAGPFRTDDKGRYIAYGLRAGSWTVYFAPDYSTLLGEYYDDSQFRTGATPIAVTYGKTVTANATIARGGRVSGLVTDEARGSIPDVTVKVYNGFGEVVGTTATTDSGSYSLAGLPTGLYRIEFSPLEGSGFAGEFYDNAFTLADAASVWVTAGSTTPAIDAELGPL